VADDAGANAAFGVALGAAVLAAAAVGVCQKLLVVPAEHVAEPALAR
jgi:hypothetical protein